MLRHMRPLSCELRHPFSHRCDVSGCVHPSGKRNPISELTCTVGWPGAGWENPASHALLHITTPHGPDEQSITRQRHTARDAEIKSSAGTGGVVVIHVRPGDLVQVSPAANQVGELDPKQHTQSSSARILGHGLAGRRRGIPSSEGFGDAYRTYTAAQVRSCRSFDRLGHDLSSACRSDRRPSFPPAVAARLGRGRRTRSLSLPLVWPPRA